jgi:hypothetical protein
VTVEIAEADRPLDVVVWRGELTDGRLGRVRRLDEHTLIVELRVPSFDEHDPSGWEASDDTIAMHAYEACILDLLGGRESRSTMSASKLFDIVASGMKWPPSQLTVDAFNELRSRLGDQRWKKAL